MNIDELINGVGRQSVRVEKASLLLMKWWIAERMSPTLLEFQEELLSEITSQVRELVFFIEETSAELTGSEPDSKIRLLIVETELERIKFIARGYLRARLIKLDQHIAYYMQRDTSRREKNETPILASSERFYAERHWGLREKLDERSFMSEWPEILQNLADPDEPVSMIDGPDLNKVVAVRVTADIPTSVQIGSDEVTLEKNNIFMLRWSAIAGILNKVELV